MLPNNGLTLILLTQLQQDTKGNIMDFFLLVDSTINEEDLYLLMNPHP